MKVIIIVVKALIRKETVQTRDTANNLYHSEYNTLVIGKKTKKNSRNQRSLAVTSQ